MFTLVRYIAGGTAFVVAAGLVAPAAVPTIDLLGASDGTAAPIANALNRSAKGDKVTGATAAGGQDTTIATVEVVGLRDAAVVYRARDGRLLFATDPITNATVVTKGVVLPEVTIRETRRNAVEPVPVPAETAPSVPAPTAAKEKKILEGCDPVFSPLTASARNNFSGRCLASLEPATKIAALTR